MKGRTPTPDPATVIGPDDETYTVTVQPSGVIGWQYDMSSGHIVEVVVLLAGAAWNVLGRLSFRFGWSVVADHETSGRRVGRRRFRSKRAAIEALPGIAEGFAALGIGALRQPRMQDHTDGLKPSDLARLDHGIVALEQDGSVHGWVATTVESFWSPGQPTRTQACVWLLFSWADGTRDPIEEDYPPYLLTTELLNGVVHDDRGTFAVRWLRGAERDRVWAEHGINGSPSDYMGLASGTDSA